MKPADYIQWHLTSEEMAEVTSPFVSYANSKGSMLNAERFNKYSNIIKSKFNNSDTEMEEYFKLIRGIIGNKNFQAAMDQAVNKISFPSTTNLNLRYNHNEIVDKLKKESKQYEKLVNEIKSALNGIIMSIGTISTSSIVDSDIQKVIADIYEDPTYLTEPKFATLEGYEKLSSQAKGQYKYLLSLLPSFSEIVKEAGNDKTGTDQSIKILEKMLLQIQTLIGFCSEFQVEYELNKIMKSLEKDLKFSGMEASMVGDEQGVSGGYRIGTTDISIKLGDNGNLSFSMPDLGISLKRTSKQLKEEKNINIKLKTGTSYGKLLYDVDPNLTTAFYTIYAYTNPRNEGDVPNNALNGAYKVMKMEATLSALIGNIHAKDLTFVLTVNNRSITIFDLLESIGDLSRDPFVLTPTFKHARGGLISAHKDFYQDEDPSRGLIRSKKVRSYIEDKMKAEVYLRLRKAQIEQMI